MEIRGRGDEVRIYPLSFTEFYDAYDGDYDGAWNEYMIYGGLPQVAQFSMERQKEGILVVFCKKFEKGIDSPLGSDGKLALDSNLSS